MKATLVLTDAAQVDPSGKVHLLGGGWSMTTTPLPGFAVVVLVAVDWSETNLPHEAVLRLEDADGHVVVVAGPDGSDPFVHRHPFEVGRPPEVPAGGSVDMPVVWSFGPGMPLAPARYLWRLEIDGDTQEAWSLPFIVREG